MGRFWIRFGLLAVLAVLASPAFSEECDTASRNCNEENCQAPDCACSDSMPDVPLNQRPQIVYITFDDALTAVAEGKYYSELFDGSITNPDGCAIRATHFLSARSMDYSLAHKYWTMGHEMASHSITHRSPIEYWKDLDVDGWVAEIAGMRKMIGTYAKVPEDEIVGVRAPFLQGGGDVQFEMMEKEGFEYDCTMPSLGHGHVNLARGTWPYTADLRAKMDCQIEPCPKCSHPGVWVQPMLDLEDDRDGYNADGDGYPCSMLDTCWVPEETADAVKDMLMRNFDRSYYGETKAPFGLYLHTSWFLVAPYRFEGYKMFLEDIRTVDDVWIVPIRAGIEYRKHPATNDELKNGTLAEFFGCDNFPKEDCFPTSCKFTEVSNEDFATQEEYIKVCDYCPDNYPWLDNPEGN